MIDANAKTILNAAAQICRDEAAEQLDAIYTELGKGDKPARDKVRPTADLLMAEHTLRAVIRRS